MESANKSLEDIFKTVCPYVISAYIDTVIFLKGVDSKFFDDGCHLYRYSFYAVRQRTIIAVKKLIEPSTKDKISIHSIIKFIQQDKEAIKSRFPHLEENIDLISKTYEELKSSEGANRLKDCRDAICHNLKESNLSYVKCGDLMQIMSFSLSLVDYIYQKMYAKDAVFLTEIRNIAQILAHDYWAGLEKAARQTDSRHGIVNRLDSILKGNFEINNGGSDVK